MITLLNLTEEEEKRKGRRVKTVTRSMEMDIETLTNERALIWQILNDIEVYGLWEACLFAEKYVGAEPIYKFFIKHLKG